jgi:hypothetical protein
MSGCGAGVAAAGGTAPARTTLVASANAASRNLMTNGSVSSASGFCWLTLTIAINTCAWVSMSLGSGAGAGNWTAGPEPPGCCCCCAPLAGTLSTWPWPHTAAGASGRGVVVERTAAVARFASARTWIALSCSCCVRGFRVSRACLGHFNRDNIEKSKACAMSSCH